MPVRYVQAIHRPHGQRRLLLFPLLQRASLEGGRRLATHHLPSVPGSPEERLRLTCAVVNQQTEVSMDQLDIILNPTLTLGSAVWDSNGTVHWAVGERAVLKDRGTMMAWAACATPQPALPPHNPGYLDAPLGSGRNCARPNGKAQAKAQLPQVPSPVLEPGDSGRNCTKTPRLYTFYSQWHVCLLWGACH